MHSTPNLSRTRKQKHVPRSTRKIALFSVTTESRQASGSALASLLRLALGLPLLLLTPVHAQIVAYKAAPASQQPTILSAGNGVPLINIRPPSAAGVSHNTYGQFDVQKQGAILNNSRNNAQTQLGGWVQGNPWLAGGTARVILNEVISANPSQLLGYLEVAGNPAQVVIANPSGVTCNGCGFINANRVTLTTGTPIISGGTLEGYRVEGGAIRIEGTGMDASGASYTDLIARAVELNAGLWAQTLGVTTGPNQVNAANTQTTPVAGTGGVPAFAVDVAQLGGMYANKITLIGTEAGVGVRNAGEIGIGTGDIAITIDGQLTNRGLINGGNTRLAATTLDNLGTGRIYGDHLAITANTLNNRDDAGQSPVIAARDRLDIGVGTLNNRNDNTATSDESATRLFSAGDLAIGRSLDADNHATGSADLVHNHGATIEALGDLSIAATDIRNTNAGFVVQTVPESSTLIQEVQPESWPQRHDVSYFPNIFNYNIEDQTYVVNGVVQGGFEDYTFYQYTASTSVTELVSSRAGRIIAGGNASLTGNLDNDNSRILAGGTLTHSGGTLTNTATPGIRTTTYNGWAEFRDWDGNDEELEFGGHYPFSPAPTITQFDLGIARLDEHASPAIGSAPGGLGSLFALSPTAAYLIETDPRFAGYRNWLSSDYLRNQFAIDPSITQKRLGDGFYEQRLITEQIAQLTGRRFLDGYADDEAQYRALMDAAVTVAQAWDLRPGVALSAEQITRLTSDIVWLVEKNITLADGSTQTVLAPQVYLRPQAGDLSPAGGLISADILRINTQGDITNSGTLAGRQLVVLDANNIQNLGGAIRGNSVGLTTQNDLLIRGGQISAANTLQLVAGGDLTLESTTRDTAHQEGNSSFTRTHLDRLAGLYVSKAGGTLQLAAAGNITLGAAQLQSAGTTRIDAGGDLTLGTVHTAQENHTGKNAGNQNHSGESIEIGSRIESTGSITLTAGRDLTARAASVSSTDGALAVIAERDIHIDAGQASSHSEISQKKKRSGTLSSKTKTQRDEFADTTAIASTFSGDTLTLAAGQDLRITGSDLVATGDLTARAGRDLTLDTAQETHSETHYKKTKESGVFSNGGASVTLGQRMQSTDQQTQTTTAAASTLGSLEGNLTLTAGQHYQQTGSDLIALKGDIAVVAEDIALREARESSRSTFTQKTKQSGLTLSISNPVISAVQSVAEISKAASNTSDPRMQALAAGSAALTGYSTYKEITKDGALDPSKATGINLSLSLGSSKSKSSSTQTSDTAAGSTLAAAGDITLTATGKEGQPGTGKLLIQGSDLTAGDDLSLTAQNDIELLAAANTQQLRSSNKSSSASIGVSIGISSKGTASGPALTAGFSQAKGKANGDDLFWSNTHLTAGDTLTLTSGNDTTLRGATASGKQITADIGGDLKLESLQDTSTYDSKQKSAGISIAISPAGVPVGGGISGSGSKIASDYKSVTQQTALRAGDGGFDIQVGGNTDLKGAAITSTQTAVKEGKNTFNTEGELTLSDLHNEATYDAQGGSVTLGTQLNEGKYTPQGTSAGYGEDEGHASSTTYAAITGYAGNSTARTGDPESGVSRIFDADKVQKEIDAQVKITQAFGQQASKAVGDYAQSKMKEAENLRALGKADEANAIEDQWGKNGTLRLLAHTVIGGLTGGTPGALGSAAGTLTAPAVSDALKDAGITGALADTITALASTAVGTAVGGTAGGSAALNEVANNFLKHPEYKSYLARRKGCESRGDCKAIDAEYRAIAQANEARAKALIEAAKTCTTNCAAILVELKAMEAEIANGESSYVLFGDQLHLGRLVGSAKDQVQKALMDQWCAGNKTGCVIAVASPLFPAVAVTAPALAGELVTACIFSPATCSEIVVAVSEGMAGTSIATNTTAGKTALRLLENEAARVGKVGVNTGLNAAEGVVASRINVRTGDANVTGSGLEYAWKKHGGAWGENKSAFTISKDELKVALQDPLVVNTPAYQSATSGNYIRTVDMGRTVGIDAKTGGQPTNFMTVITDSKGNLVNTFPGRTF